ncbi:astacin-like metalloprotease toxin 5 [Uloborus diversus]|uniref:astacin-like metalloprotease toxin 5 n=1 Tax=Uloborus diversus TaxID=327109 RepID=UPI002409BEEF|nr:astacin-like metalloprotease toxin 5 [Uloborus diversus]
MKLLIVLVLYAGVCYAADTEYLGHLPMENPDLLGGDMLGFEDVEDRNAIVDKRQIWPNGVVPYVLEEGIYKTVPQAVMTNAMWLYKRDTCIRFVPRTDEKDYIRIFPGQGCYSHVGKTGNAQPLSLGQGCGYMGTVLHELAHALGFYHEQNRSDRDDYLTIFWENIKEGMEDQFFKLKPDQNQLLTQFDYDSLMLYGSYTFSKDRRNLKTMVGKDDRYLKDVINKYFLSASDLNRIKMLYKCP